MLEILPRSQEIEQSKLTMWVDESIWGHRLHDEQTPWLCLLEMLCITQSEAAKRQAFRENEFNKLKYDTYPRIHLRNIIFNNPHLEAIASEYSDDAERWNNWIEKISKNCGGIQNPDFSYLKQRFDSFKDFSELVKFLQSNAIEGDSNKRWSSKFVFPYGPSCLYGDLLVSGSQESPKITNDRRFFGRTGELLYLMLCRSGCGEEIFSRLQRIGIIASEGLPANKASKWNQLILALQPKQELESERPQKSGTPPYLPYAQLSDYENLAKDWLNILRCNLPDYDALPHIVTITGLHLIIYLLSRAKARLEETEPPKFVLEIVAPKKTIIRDLASDEYQKNNNLSQRAIEHYIRSTTELPEWQKCLESSNPFEEARDILKERFAWPAKDEDYSSGAGSPESLLENLREEAVRRHKKHLAKFHGSWAREIGLSSSRGSRRTRYAPSDALLRTLVLACVPHRMEFQDFLTTLNQKYGFAIGDKQAENIISSGDADREDFTANAERLERRLASIGLLKRLSDACAYVLNPIAREVS
ncbi:MAG TPA: hypothetical protein DCL61_05045 [Cyanobacteria bacterium UBA12227]|nr:hypothetical protein [Cyanobacteria bacterium UBA12227]HAX84753.1 hypothetical protein [Cyanobacteria bacterium UBA11370]HBY81560.1 hypothetical protein [Cyanobacteria bacterium UBA11148]